MKRNIIKKLLYLQYLLSWQVTVYIHHRKKPQCLTWLWRMWRHWLVTRVVVVMIVVIHVLEHFVDILFQRVQLHKLQYITNS